MIRGAVNLMRRPSITIALIGGTGQPWPIEAHLDTGFSGGLTLPKSAIERLELEFSGSTTYRTGNSVMTPFNSYEATIQWHNSIRNITVLESENFPLVGVGLLWGNNLSIDFRHGGDVIITELFDL